MKSIASVFPLKRVHLTLKDNGVGIAVFAHRWAHHPSLQDSISVRPLAGEAPSWISSLEAAQDWLNARAPAGRGVLEVVVDDALVRYAIVPFHRELRRKAERIALARACFESSFGGAMSQWQIRTDVSRRGPAISCAIRQEILDAIRTFCDKSKLALHSLRPLFISKMNAAQRAVSERELIVLSAVGGSICGAHKVGGNWASIWSRSATSDSLLEPWQTQLHRECLLRGYPEEAPVLVLGSSAAMSLASFQDLLSDKSSHDAH